MCIQYPQAAQRLFDEMTRAEEAEADAMQSLSDLAGPKGLTALAHAGRRVGWARARLYMGLCLDERKEDTQPDPMNVSLTKEELWTILHALDKRSVHEDQGSMVDALYGRFLELVPGYECGKK